METTETFLTSGMFVSSPDGILTKSLLDNTSLSPTLGSTSGFLSFQQAFKSPSATSIYSDLDWISASDTRGTDLSANVLQFVDNVIDGSLLFKQSFFLTTALSSSLINDSTRNNSTTDFDPLTGNAKDAPLVSTTGSPTFKTASLSKNSVKSTDANSPNDSLVSVGKFGDFDGHQDFQLTLQDTNGNPETFSLTGDGVGEVFRNSNFEQVIFKSTDASTKVQISAFNNIKFGNYTGSSLQVQTKGSISAGNITLKNTASSSSPGLSLQSGLIDTQNSTGSSYSITDLNTLFKGNFYATDINDTGQMVGSSYTNTGFLYSDGKITDLGTLSGDSRSLADSINNSGQVVGTSYGRYNLSAGRAFLYSDGKITDLGTLPGGTVSRAGDINNSGQVIGNSDVMVLHDFSGNGYGSEGIGDLSENHAFLYSDGNMTDLGTLLTRNNLSFAGSSYAADINDSGQVVGLSNTDDGPYHAFLYSNGKMTDLGTLSEGGGNYSEAIDINNSGQVIGNSEFLIPYHFSGDGYGSEGDGYTSVKHAFLYSDGKMTDLGTLLSENNSSLPGYSSAISINDSGQVIGYSNNHFFLYSNGKMTDLESLIPKESGWSLQQLRVINNKGQILGGGSIGGQFHQFLLNPISTTATPKDGITVGNISTQGSSVFLQGLKINLTGSNVVTKGGNVTLDGPTILNSSTGAYTFNSAKSTVTSKGGDITFKNTLDSNSAGASSLSLTGGLGNITFNNAVGGNASLKDLTVNSAKTVTAKGDITSQGNITLNAIDDITTASLSTTDSGNVNISLGKIGNKKYDSKGNVTTGNITAKQVDILSDGAFRTQGDIQTQDGDVNITALKDVVVHNITSTNAGISLISATNAITATGEITADNGLTALAKQNITTEKIQSANDVVLLNSSQGAVTVNGSITSNSDVSLGAFKDVVTQDITSLDGAVALISSSGNVKAQGAIASVDNVTLGATQDVLAQSIVSAFGTVALVSNKGNVTTTEINSGSQVAIQADQNVTTGKITSQWDKVALIAKQGTVTTQGDITTNNGDVYISSVGDVISQNIISNGGVIAIDSSQGAVTTGYLRSDGNNTGGKIYVQADGSVRVTGSVSINDANYSIYTGVNKKRLISIAYESGVLKSNKSKFVIGNANINGTAAGIYGPYAFNEEDIPRLLRDTGVLLFRIIEEIFKGNDNQPTTNPSHVADINPITGNPYSNQRERELVEQLKIAQQRRLNVLIHNKNNPERITEQEVFTKGKVDSEDGCFNLELARHLGDQVNIDSPDLGKDITHSKYATYVTGSPGDYLVITPLGLFAFYDGLVRAEGAIVNNGNGSEPIGSVAEVKTGYKWLKKYLILPDAPNYTPPTQLEKFKFQRMISQIDREAEVAKDCGLQYFMCFSDKEAGLAARDLFEYKQPPRTKNSVAVHHIRFPRSF
ncbi:DUF3466 family protein [Nostoc sp. WHI]|uniref:DUF3466 family protein n=1 Tax=Nostoc sp. WHI TaxID=2650611 RepID=UPI0018C6E901|nr:DUF3466 family protein [Nostoc sp. WHI]MBG1266331.1 hypothetical protein [Nostoc sp. WHI]